MATNESTYGEVRSKTGFWFVRCHVTDEAELRIASDTHLAKLSSN